jgi:RNA recognition motif-containing protein
LPDDFDEEKIRKLFGEFGPIGYLNCSHGNSAKISYFTADKNDLETGPKAAAAAVQALNDYEVNGKKIYVRKLFRTKTEIDE